VFGVARRVRKRQPARARALSSALIYEYLIFTEQSWLLVTVIRRSQDHRLKKKLALSTVFIPDRGLHRSNTSTRIMNTAFVLVFEFNSTRYES